MNKGFTLIELVIAIGIFVIVVSVALSLFLTGLAGHRKTIAIQNVQDNARYLLEFVAKEVRMSEIKNANYYRLVITRPDGEEITYAFEGGNIQRTITGNPSGSGPMNSNEVSISGQFYTLGIGKDDNQQPRVTIVMKAETTGKTEEKARIELQTTLNPRNLEL